MSKKQLGVLLVCICAVSLIGCGAKTELKLNLQPGDEREVTVEQVVSQTMSIMGMEMDQGSENNITYGFKVESVDPAGVATVAGEYKSVYVEESNSLGMGDEMGLSDKVKEALEGETFTMRIAPDGTVESVSGLKDISEDVMKDLKLPEIPAMPGMFGGGAVDLKKTIGDQLRAQYGPDTLREQMTGLFKVYPQQPVKVGDSWTNETSLTSPIRITEITTSTLQELQGVSAKIDLASQMQTEAGAALMEIGGMSVKADLKGTGTGAMTIDTESGWIKKAEMTQQVNGNVSVDLPGMGSQGASVPMSISVRTSIQSFAP